MNWSVKDVILREAGDGEIVTLGIILRDSLGDILRGRANAHFSGFSFCADLLCAQRLAEPPRLEAFAIAGDEEFVPQNFYKFWPAMNVEGSGEEPIDIRGKVLLWMCLSES